MNKGLFIDSLLERFFFKKGWKSPRFKFYFWVIIVFFSLITIIIPEIDKFPTYNGYVKYSVPLIAFAVTIISASGVDIVTSFYKSKDPPRGIDVIGVGAIVLPWIISALCFFLLDGMWLFIVSIALYLIGLIVWVLANVVKYDGDDEFENPNYKLES